MQLEPLGYTHSVGETLLGSQSWVAKTVGRLASPTVVGLHSAAGLHDATGGALEIKVENRQHTSPLAQSLVLSHFSVVVAQAADADWQTYFGPASPTFE